MDNDTDDDSRYNFLRDRKPSALVSLSHATATFAFAGNAKKSIKVSPVTFPAGCRVALVSRPLLWWVT